jgi:hypothetical protein
MLPQARLTARLKKIPAVAAIVGENVLPVLVPSPSQYPAVVYQVLSNVPWNDADGGSNSYTMRLRVSCVSLSQGNLRPYEMAWSLASAVAGDAENPNGNGPTGLSGWVDEHHSVWHLADEFDEAGEIQLGTDTFYAYVVNQLYDVQYVRHARP